MSQAMGLCNNGPNCSVDAYEHELFVVWCPQGEQVRQALNPKPLPERTELFCPGLTVANRQPYAPCKP